MAGINLISPINVQQFFMRQRSSYIDNEFSQI